MSRDLLPVVRWLGAIVICLIQMGAAGAETRALVVGINEYRQTKLKGAVNDAELIAKVLREAGVRDLTLLLEADANRDRLVDGLERLAARSNAGDLVIVSFAGHGRSEPWGASHPADVSEGELREIFLLYDYLVVPTGRQASLEDQRRSGEQFTGREMQDWIRKIERKGARSIFVADTCHGGGLSREPAVPDVTRLPGRLWRDARPDAQPHTSPFRQTDPAKRLAHFRELPHFSLLAAVEADKVVHEIRLGGRTGEVHGALSWAFAEAVAGHADADRDGQIRRSELFHYLRGRVAALTQSLQTPALEPSEQISGADPDFIAIDLARDLPGLKTQAQVVAPQADLARRVMQSRGASAISDSTDTMEIAIVPSEANAPPPRLKADPGLRLTLAPASTSADLLWSPQRSMLFNGQGDLLAQRVGESDIPDVARRQKAAARLADIAASRPWPLRLTGGQRVLRQAELVSFDARHWGDRTRNIWRYLLLEIGPFGEVRLLAPDPAEANSEKLSAEHVFPEFEVDAPFGLSTVVIIVAPASLKALATALEGIDGTRAPAAAVDLIALHLPPEGRIGLLDLYSAPMGIAR